MSMNHTIHNKLVSFIWSIADDCLRDVYVRGQYPDVILPMKENKTTLIDNALTVKIKVPMTEKTEAQAQA